MKTVSPALLALLNNINNVGITNVFVFCDLYTFTLTSGTVLRYTTSDCNISDNSGNIYSSKGPYFEKVKTSQRFHAKAGLDVDNWAVDVMPRMSDPVTGAAYPDMIGNVPWLQAVVAGVLDGATVQVDRAYFNSWATGGPPQLPVGILTKLFYGRTGQIACTRTTATITFNSWMTLLQNTMMPPNIYGGRCSHTLFDAGCGLNAASFMQTGSIAASWPVPANTQSLLINVTPPAGLTYALGRIIMTSGQNAGLQQRILSYTPNWPGFPTGTNAIVLGYPFPFPIADGDQFQIYPGCDKTMTTCEANPGFNNLLNHRGFEFIPVPELAL
jgi:hypothetical protein